MAKDLWDKGCVPAKSLILTFPSETQVPSHLIHHFVRGYFDGDGSISLRRGVGAPYIGFVGTEMFISELCKFLDKMAIEWHIYTRFPERNNSTRQLMFWGYDQVKTFHDWMYKDSTICLQRKKDLFDKVKFNPEDRKPLPRKCKPIVETDESGAILASFESVKQAAETLGFNKKSLENVMCGKARSLHGRIFRYA